MSLAELKIDTDVINGQGGQTVELGDTGLAPQHLEDALNLLVGFGCQCEPEVISVLALIVVRHAWQGTDGFRHLSYSIRRDTSCDECRGIPQSAGIEDGSQSPDHAHLTHSGYSADNLVGIGGQPLGKDVKWSGTHRKVCLDDRKDSLVQFAQLGRTESFTDPGRSG